MTKTISWQVLDRLEREWRVIDPDRPKPDKPAKRPVETPRLKIGRSDP